MITFEDLKKIVLKNKEFWQLHHIGGLESRSKERGTDMIPEPSPENSFPFNEFVNAFKVSKQSNNILNSNYAFHYRLWDDLGTPKQENQTQRCSS